MFGPPPPIVGRATRLFLPRTVPKSMCPLLQFSCQALSPSQREAAGGRSLHVFFGVLTLIASLLSLSRVPGKSASRFPKSAFLFIDGRRPFLYSFFSCALAERLLPPFSPFLFYCYPHTRADGSSLPWSKKKPPFPFFLTVAAINRGVPILSARISQHLTLGGSARTRSFLHDGNPHLAEIFLSEVCSRQDDVLLFPGGFGSPMITTAQVFRTTRSRASVSFPRRFAI